jgi:transketolase
MRKTALDMVHRLARRDPRVVFVGSDLGPGTLEAMKTEMPERFFMEGVCEQNIVGLAAGLAMDGFIPYVNTIATFLTRRCFEQIAIDLCLHRLPVRLIANGGGVVYAPLGPTHLALEDMGILRTLPHMTVVAPADATEMERFMECTLDWPDPIYIRLGKGGDPVVTKGQDGFTIGAAVTLRPPGEATVLTTGVMAGPALAAAETLAAGGVTCGVLHLPTVKPLDQAAILSVARSSRLLVTLEEHTLMGGLGSAVAELLVDRLDGPLPRLKRLGLPDAFPQEYGSQETMFDSFGLTGAAVVGAVRDLLARPS